MLIISDNIEIGKPFQEGLTCYLEGSVFDYNTEPSEHPFSDIVFCNRSIFIKIR